MAKARRTTHRSTAGKKMYAVRNSDGQFKDIQTYERAHRADLAKSSKKEVEAKVNKAAKAAAEAVGMKATPVAKKTKRVAKKAVAATKKPAAAAKKVVKKVVKKTVKKTVKKR